MASSSYYYSEMLDYSRAKRTSEERKEQYNNYLKKLENLNLNLEKACENFEKSESTFKEGGYVNDGVPIGNDILKNNYQSLDKVISKIEEIIKNTKDRMDDISDEIDKNVRLYNKAKKNYDKAKKEESMS